MPFTEEELINFSQQPDITFTEISTQSSLKSNILILFRNFVNLQIYLSKLKAYVKYVNGLIDVEYLIIQILNRFQTNKINLLIDSTALNSINHQIVNSISYKIERISDYEIEITNDTDENWITDNLIVQIKTFEGMIVYPVIATFNKKIKIFFADKIAINYNVFFL